MEYYEYTPDGMCYKHKVEKYDKGYLATINVIDTDGDVLYGCSGEFCDTEHDAEVSAFINLITTDWK